MEQPFLDLNRHIRSLAWSARRLRLVILHFTTIQQHLAGYLQRVPNRPFLIKRPIACGVTPRRRAASDYDTHSFPTSPSTNRCNTDAGRGGDQWRNVKHWRCKRHVCPLPEGGIPASKAGLWITAIPSRTERFASMSVSRTRPYSRSASPVTQFAVTRSHDASSSFGRPSTILDQSRNSIYLLMSSFASRRFRRG